MDEWNLPENCKLSLTAIQNNDPTDLQTRFRLRLADDHNKKVSESTISSRNLKVDMFYSSQTQTKKKGKKERKKKKESQGKVLGFFVRVILW